MAAATNPILACGPYEHVPFHWSRYCFARGEEEAVRATRVLLTTSTLAYA